MSHILHRKIIFEFCLCQFRNQALLSKDRVLSSFVFSRCSFACSWTGMMSLTDLICVRRRLSLFDLAFCSKPYSCYAELCSSANLFINFNYKLFAIKRIIVWLANGNTELKLTLVNNLKESGLNTLFRKFTQVYLECNAIKHLERYSKTVIVIPKQIAHVRL